jgi:hypothetical protein
VTVLGSLSCDDVRALMRFVLDQGVLDLQKRERPFVLLHAADLAKRL